MTETPTAVDPRLERLNEVRERFTNETYDAECGRCTANGELPERAYDDARFLLEAVDELGEAVHHLNAIAEVQARALRLFVIAAQRQPALAPLVDGILAQAGLLEPGTSVVEAPEVEA